MQAAIVGKLRISIQIQDLRAAETSSMTGSGTGRDYIFICKVNKISVILFPFDRSVYIGQDG